MTLDYLNLLDRVCAIQLEALAALSTPVTAVAKPFFLYSQETFPYFTNRISADEIGFDSEDFDRDTLDVIMRLTIGHITEGYQGQPESTLYSYLPALKLYFNQREWLQSATYTTAMPHLIEARVVGHVGFRVFQNTGISAQQVGSELTLRVQFDESAEEIYT